MPSRKKINLEKMRASIATPCPYCEYKVPPAVSAPNLRDKNLSQCKMTSAKGRSLVLRIPWQVCVRMRP
jgi:hypothetical protein